MIKRTLVSLLLATVLFTPQGTEAHRSGCHRWHSCPSDSGSYTCGDTGHPCSYPTYPASGGVIYPASGYYKDCYDCAWKKVVGTDTRLWKSTFKRDDSGTEVLNLQKALKAEGVFTDTPTGYYGAVTEQAVKDFQAKHGIVTSGTPLTTGYGAVGWATMTKLNALYGANSL